MRPGTPCSGWSRPGCGSACGPVTPWPGWAATSSPSSSTTRRRRRRGPSASACSARSTRPCRSATGRCRRAPASASSSSPPATTATPPITCCTGRTPPCTRPSAPARTASSSPTSPRWCAWTSTSPVGRSSSCSRTTRRAATAARTTSSTGWAPPEPDARVRPTCGSPDGEAGDPHLEAGEPGPRAVDGDPVPEGAHAGQAGPHVLDRDAAELERRRGRREVLVAGRVRAEGVGARGPDVALLEEPADGVPAEAGSRVEVVVGPARAPALAVVPGEPGEQQHASAARDPAVPALERVQVAHAHQEVAALLRDPGADVEHDERHERPALVELAQVRGPGHEVRGSADVRAGVGAQARDPLEQVPVLRNGVEDRVVERRGPGGQRIGGAQLLPQRYPPGGAGVDLLVAAGQPAAPLATGGAGEPRRDGGDAEEAATAQVPVHARSLANRRASRRRFGRGRADRRRPGTRCAGVRRRPGRRPG